MDEKIKVGLITIGISTAALILIATGFGFATSRPARSARAPRRGRGGYSRVPERTGPQVYR